MSDAELHGHHALVTGAGRGLGRACALALAEKGAVVTAVARTEAELQSLASEALDTGCAGAVHPAVADVLDPEAFRAVVAVAEEHSPLDILVASAGTNRPGPTIDKTLDDYDAVMDLNVRASFVAAQEFGRLLLAAERPGRLVLMSSQMGSVGYPGRAIYCASKHAVNGLTKALAVEWASAGITVNAVAPTFVLTPLTEPMFEDPEFRDEVLRRIPAGKLAELDHVAAAVLYLVSDAAAMTTGQILGVDGGWTAW